MARKKNFLPVEPEHLSHVLRWIVKEKERGALVLASSKEGTPLGGVLVVRSATRSWGVFSATVKDTRLVAGHVLQWRAIRGAKEIRCADIELVGYRMGGN